MNEFFVEILTSSEIVLSRKIVHENQWVKCSTCRTWKDVTTETAYLVDEIQTVLSVSTSFLPRVEYRITNSQGKELRRKLIR